MRQEWIHMAIEEFKHFVNLYRFKRPSHMGMVDRVIDLGLQSIEIPKERVNGLVYIRTCKSVDS